MTTINDLNRLVNAIYQIVEAEPDTLHTAINTAKEIADDVSRTYCLDGSVEEEDPGEELPLCRHRDDGRGVCIDCGTFLPTSESRPAPRMTFEQFQATKTESADLRSDLPDQFAFEDYPDPVPGLIYDGSYWIDAVQDSWPEAARREGRWHLAISNMEWISDDLESLERRLWEFAS